MRVKRFKKDINSVPRINRGIASFKNHSTLPQVLIITFEVGIRRGGSSMMKSDFSPGITLLIKNVTNKSWLKTTLKTTIIPTGEI